MSASHPPCWTERGEAGGEELDKHFVPEDKGNPASSAFWPSSLTTGWPHSTVWVFSECPESSRSRLGNKALEGEKGRLRVKEGHVRVKAFISTQSDVVQMEGTEDRRSMLLAVQVGESKVPS